MRARVIPSSKGTKGLDWQRIFIVQLKTFLIWREFKRFDTAEEARSFIYSLADWNEIVFVKYI